jgi:CDP-paratose 2-epimerase
MKILITGGLGFIGVNTAIKLSKNNEVYVLDNFSRKGNQENLKEINEDKIKIIYRDIRNFFDMEEVFKNVKPDVIIHLAGQVAVTTSIKNPREDFEINTLGTFNILECMRTHAPNSSLLYASTNKVYGEFNQDVIEEELNYKYKNITGIDENMMLDFHSPYGCSKGSADQYVRDYSRTYGLKTVVLRQSCIYGENQFGVEDQGWVAWFTIATTFNQEITIYGNGKQVRDVLHIDDLVDLYEKIINNLDICSGKIYNIGGGPKNSMSILQLINLLKTKHYVNYKFGDWRVGDQKIYISNIDKINRDINWEPKINVVYGIEKLHKWVTNNENKFKKLKLIK